MNMKIQSFLILILFLCFAWGCGDEGVLLEGLVPSGPSPLVDVGPVPEDIQEILWGADADTLKAELKDYMDRDVHGGVIDHQINRICLRHEQEAYYGKYISAGGVAIMGHSHIDDRVFYAARDIVLGMTRKRPELRALLTPTREYRPGATRHDGIHDVTRRYTPSRKFRMILVERDMSPTSIPEKHRGLGTVNYNTAPYGGEAGTNYAWAYVGNAESSNDIWIYHFFSHEFAHAIHFAIELLDPTFDDRLKAAYDTARENNSFTATRTYNSSEYWAQAATDWFYRIVREPVYHDLVLQEDPLLYALLSEWFDLIDLRVVESRVYE
ncbi:MAG: hypothetical protein OYL97_08690 [Candidatus Poribacteria bacterium]|nr:hypothetical protein [Candidatus Poribacteria bacterium]